MPRSNHRARPTVIRQDRLSVSALPEWPISSQFRSGRLSDDAFYFNEQQFSSHKNRVAKKRHSPLIALARLQTTCSHNKTYIYISSKYLRSETTTNRRTKERKKKKKKKSIAGSETEELLHSGTNERTNEGEEEESQAKKICNVYKRNPEKKKSTSSSNNNNNHNHKGEI